MNNTENKDKKKYYIDPQELREALVESQKEAKCTEKLGELILLINKAVMNFPKFRLLDREMKEELVSYSNYRLLKRGIFTAKPDNPRLFSYFTTAISTNCLQRKIQIEKKERDKKEFEREQYKNMGYNFIDYSDFYKEDNEND